MDPFLCVFDSGPGLVTPFEFDPSIKVIFGAGTLSQLGEHIRALAGTSVLIVSDAGIVRAGIVDRASDTLTSAGLHLRVFDDVSENPSSRDIDAGLVVAREGKSIDLLVALGGGSAMDCAKGINFLLTNGGRIEDYHGFGKAGRPMLPSIGIPTTAGTGSEAQSYAYRVMPDEELFDVMQVSLEVPEQDLPGRPVSRIACESCGEGVNDRREVLQDGRKLCVACANGAYYSNIDRAS